ncbi:hypothetical protein ACFQ08_34410, partial [Streptosporangium algeriense]
MRMRPLGRTGIQVSPSCLGTMMSGRVGDPDHDECARVAHPGVTAAIIGPRTMERLGDLLAGAGTVLDDDLLDRIDEILSAGSDTGPLDVSYDPPAVTRAGLR